MDSDNIDITSTLELQATSEYGSAIVETEDRNEDGLLDTENWGLFPGFQLPCHSKIGRRAWIRFLDSRYSYNRALEQFRAGVG